VERPAGTLNHGTRQKKVKGGEPPALKGVGVTPRSETMYLERVDGVLAQSAEGATYK